MVCGHGAVTQSAIMISAIYYPVLTRLISSNGITNPQRWLGYVILHPSERQKSRAESGLGCFLSFVMFILILFFLVFICFWVGEEIKMGDSHWFPVEHLLYKVSFI